MTVKEIIYMAATALGIREEVENYIEKTQEAKKLYDDGKKDAAFDICFDEVITEGAEKVSYKLDIDRVIFETKKEYENLRDILALMIHTPGEVQTRETIRYKKEEFTIVKTFTGAILEGDEFEMKPEEHTAQSLSFVCASKDETTE